MTGAMLLTGRDDLGDVWWERMPVPVPPAGSVLVAVEAVACTANTFTYGQLGDRLGYWEFFPTGRPGWGCLPAWGTGVVLDSRCADVPAGSRLFGLLPLATHCLLTPTRATAGSLRDGSAHRRALPGAYQHYERLPATAGPDEQLRALLHPLFVLAFLLAGQLRAELGGAGSVVLTSASSKTAHAIAQQLDGSGVGVVGLTSPQHASACRASGLFGSVLTYADVDLLPAHVVPGRGILVDLAGDPTLRKRIQTALTVDTVLVDTVLVGSTHRATPDGDPVYSAVERLRAVSAELGPAELARRQERAWRSYADRCAGSVTPLLASGRAEIERAYREVLDGRCAPDHGHLLALGPP